MEFSRRQFMAGAGALAAAPAVLGDAKKVFKIGLAPIPILEQLAV